MMRSDRLRQIQGFDENYFLHCEDLDLMQQISLKNWRVLLVPAAGIMHHQGVSGSDRPGWVERHKHRGMAYFYKKFHARTNSFITNWIVYLGIYTHLAYALVKLRLGRQS